MTTERVWAARRRLAVVVLALLVGAGVLAGFAAAPDVVYLDSAAREPRKAPPPARFSHGEHRAFGCYECHPGLFSTPRTRVTHADMKQGVACGACHDGRAARSFQELGCKSCHTK